MNRKVALGLILSSAAVLLSVSVLWWLVPGDEPLPETELMPGAARPSAEEYVDVDLYFPGRFGRLYPERRQVELARDPVEQVGHVVREVLRGPQSRQLAAPLPAGTTLGGVHLGDGGVVYIDLQSPEQAPPPPSGSSREMLMVYSLVDSVSLNVAAVERVCLLWNGQQKATFAGHIDTTYPLAPDTSLVANLASNSGRLEPAVAAREMKPE